MHKALVALQEQLEKLVAQVQATVPNEEPFGNAHASWNFPGLTRAELVEEAQSLVELVQDHGSDDVRGHQDRLQDYVRRIQHLVQHTAPQLWSNAPQAVPAYLLTLGGLRKVLVAALDQDEQAAAVVKLKKLANRLRSLEAKLSGLEPRTVSLATMVGRIEQAYSAADQLPTDLESLAEARQKIDDLVRNATQDQGRILDVRERADDLDNKLLKSSEEASAVLLRCETAYSAATSVGLAAAFGERSIALAKSMWFWVAGLIIALAAGSVLGAGRLQKLSELFMRPEVPPLAVAMNLLLSVLSVGAPIWFAWLATKQIGQRFRLSEDYAFKASISRAYEGFRREAARFDKEMEAKLLSSALTRLDELPLRLVEPATHGSPWHELASSEAVKQAIKAVPGFAEQVQALASKSIEAVKPPKLKAKPAQTVEAE